MNRLILLLLLILSAFLNSAFAEHLSSNLIFTARMNGENEVPSVTTDGQGVGIFTFDEKKSTLYVNVSLSNLSGSITGIHIHDAATGVNGPVLINLTPFLNGNRVKGAVYNISKETMAKFLTGGLYINAHTEINPGGEIRGQIGLETDLRFAALMNGVNEVPEVTTNGTGLFIANLSGDRNEVKFKMIFQGLTSPVVGAHIHQGAIGTNGGVILDLATFFVGGNFLTGTWDALLFLDALIAGELYVNVHTVDHPGGEIRGQLLLQEGLTFDVSFDGSQENPAVDTKGKGLGIATVRPDLSEVEYFVVFDSLSGSASSAHFHNGAAGSNGGVVINMSNDINANVIAGSQPITVELLNLMLEGGLYMNIHTLDHPAGEVRGQVYKLAREAYTFDMNGGQEAPPANSTATGAGMASIDRDETNVHFMIVYNGLQGAFAASHFHVGKPGVSGPVIFTLNNFFNSFGAAEGYWDELSSQPFDETAAGYFKENEVYANVHSSLFPAGEIRGNLIRSSGLFTDQPFDPHFSTDLMFSATLSGADENPPVSTNGFGLATIFFNQDRTTAKVNVTVSSLSGPVMAAHIHDGISGENGPVVFPLPFVGNRIQTEITGITADQLGKFVDGSYYINVHTANHPGGEIRGQIFSEQDITWVAGLDGSQENPAVTTDGIGLGAFHYTLGTLSLDVNIQLKDLSTEITGAHLHSGLPGVNGPVIIDLGSLRNGNRIQGTIDITLTNLISLATGNVYVNVHTTDNPGGEIRGHLIGQNGLTFDGWLSGLQEVPFANTSASGLAVATVSPDLTNVNVWMVADAVSGTIGASHFHRAVVGSNGPVVHDLSASLLNNTIQFSGPISEDVINSLLSGEIYINAHTPAYPGGELRGQMFRLARDGYGFDLCPEQEVGTVDAPTAKGSAMVSIDRLHTNANISIVADGMTGDINAGHFHQAPIGVNGGVVFDLTPGFSGNSLFGSGIPMDTSVINAIRSGNAYVNVHTSIHPGGEMRGQTVKEFLCSIETGITPIEEIVGEVKLSPVPVIDVLDISIETNRMTTLSMNIFDLSGRMLTTDQFSLTEGKNEVRVRTDVLSPGFYLLMITDGNASQTYKFVK